MVSGRQGPGERPADGLPDRPAGTDVITLQAADLSLGTHTLEFRANTGKLPQLEQESAALTFTVRDISSPWAAETIENAIAADLVPAALQKNFTKAITRQQAAQMFVSQLEAAAGKDMAARLADRGLSPASVSPEALAWARKSGLLRAWGLSLPEVVGCTGVTRLEGCGLLALYLERSGK